MRVTLVSLRTRFLSAVALLFVWAIGSAALGAQTPPGDADSYPRIDLKRDCGAQGDGKTNDTAAFQQAAERIQKAGGGTLIIPKGVYVVGRQTHEPGKTPYYRREPIFYVKGVKYLVIEGNGALIRIAPGLRFGSFHKDTGERYDPPAMPFTDYNYAVAVGSIIHVDESRNIEIRDLELDGNLAELIIGGQFGDTGRQLSACGLQLYNNVDVRLHRIHSHHHALDGVMIGWHGLKESDPPTPHELVDCVFEYNGRQGLSWVGGRGLKAIRCKFNHTQRGLNGGQPFGSAPGAGVDIEAEESICRDGYFEDCEFVNNGGCGMVADSGDGGYSKFVRCTFWGSTNWSAWSAKPGLVYEDCVFHGSAVHAVGSPKPELATRWIRCTFEDKPWEGKGPYGNFLAELNGNLENVLFEACTFTANSRRTIWCSGHGAIFRDCTFTHKATTINPGDYQCLIRGATLSGCHFKEQFPPETKAQWFIITDGTRVLEGKPTTVDGPHVRWGGPNGPIGQIPADKDQ